MRSDPQQTPEEKRDQKAQMRRAFGLLRRAAEPDRHHLGWAVLWLIVAAGLEVIGPLLGKRLIDEHLRRVAAGEGSVLFGLNSFGEGLDLPGEACTTVVITQVPFAVPTDPQTATLSEWVEARGMNAFNLIAIPHALRTLTQFAGRLIRTSTDTGRVVILDSRLLTRRYGKRIIDALPPFKRVIG